MIRSRSTRILTRLKIDPFQGLAGWFSLVIPYIAAVEQRTTHIASLPSHMFALIRYVCACILPELPKTTHLGTGHACLLTLPVNLSCISASVSRFLSAYLHRSPVNKLSLSGPHLHATHMNVDSITQRVIWWSIHLRGSVRAFWHRARARLCVACSETKHNIVLRDPLNGSAQ